MSSDTAEQQADVKGLILDVKALAGLLKESTDIAEMEGKLDEIRETVTMLSCGGMGATLHDIRLWIKECDRIQIALPRFVSWNRRKERLKAKGKVSAREEKWMQRINDAIQSGWIARIKGLAHYFLMRYQNVRYKDEHNVRITEAESQADAIRQLAQIIGGGKQEDVPDRQRSNM